MDQASKVSGGGDKEKATPQQAYKIARRRGTQVSAGAPNNRATRASNNSTNTGGSGSGNNSDNSGIVSLGNNSFGFNFEEEGMMNISNSVDPSKRSDIDGSLNSEKPAGAPQQQHQQHETSTQQPPQPQQPIQQQIQQQLPVAAPQLIVTTQTASLPTAHAREAYTHAQAAANAVANLKSIAASNVTIVSHTMPPQAPVSSVSSSPHGQHAALISSSGSALASVPLAHMSSTNEEERPKKRSKKLDENKREERNAREKERSFRISRQIDELRNLLSSGGVIVPKGTKSSVLTEAANYIRVLQQHQYRSEIDRHQLVQQMQMIGGGALGQQAASAIRHVAAKNGVWSLGNFGGVPPKSAMSYYQDRKSAPAKATESEQPPDPNAPLPTKIEVPEYRFIFNSCYVGMAIASMGGAFIDCNQLFSLLSNYSKPEVCSMTIFNLTSRQDLQHAFDLISQMISPPVDGRQPAPKLCVLRGAMKNRDDLGLSVTLIKGDDGIAKCFCVTLIKNPASPFDPSKPIPASADMVQPQLVLQPQQMPSPQPQPVIMRQQIPSAAIHHSQIPPTIPQPQLVTIQQQPTSIIIQQQSTTIKPPSNEKGSGNLNSSPAYTTG